MKGPLKVRKTSAPVCTSVHCDNGWTGHLVGIDTLHVVVCVEMSIVLSGSFGPTCPAKIKIKYVQPTHRMLLS